MRLPRHPLRAGEHEQVADDLRGAVAVLVDPPQLARGAGVPPPTVVDQQLEMPEDALERVVHLVRDAGDELSERRELLGLRQALAQRLALGLEPRLRA